MSRTAQISPDVRLPDESANHGQVAVPALSSGSPLVAALFVQADGCYAGRADIDAWPQARDARLYDGPLPVVAHPPCQRWGNLACVNFSRYGGAHQVGGKFGTDIPKPTLTKREANATPLEFRDELLRLALLANGRSEPAQPPISK